MNQDGQLADESGRSISGRFEKLDQITSKMNSVATIFSKSGDDFVRVITNIKNDNGERAIETTLNKEGLPYKEVMKGNEYIGEADILGSLYITKYIPIFYGEDVIGIYFIGVPMQSVNKIVDAGQRSLAKSFVITSIIILIVTSISSYFVGDKISRPILDLTTVVKRHSELDFRFDEKSKAANYLNRKDEIGIMVKSLANMEQNVRELLTTTLDASNQMAASSEELTGISNQSASASDEVARTIEEIAKGASDQARDTEESVASVQEMGQLIEEEKQNIQELNNISEEINRQKEDGFSILNDLIEKTEENNKAVMSVHEIIIGNNVSAERIEDASSMIQSIADQTNLLALNAAIEAARAGEAGRGFAVVADEIRKLAEQSNRFTEEIKEVIMDLKARSEEAVQTMNKVTEIVGLQTKSVQETHKKFDMIADSVEASKAIIDKLNSMSSMMDEHKIKLIDIMQNLSAISEENAAGTQEALASIEEQVDSVKEIANASEGLSHLAEELQQLIVKFKI
ncbi:methyl-accepting chemotaxis protein [Proteiniborus sp. DW1]|uniref:methyl-accepting chemotaxis protein n=1 Tax=Proteiniborus sp. DW1 TaxID=1889883 RepID=UPI00325B2B55